MATPIYRTHDVVKRLIEAGLTELQAEAIVNEQVQLLAAQLATKADLQAVETKLHSEITVLRADMKAIEARITSRLSVLIIAVSTALAAVIKIF